MSDPVARLNAALEGRYAIERELGTGGMATVYLADDIKHERKVALKVLKPELAAVVGAERFLGEIKTTANLQHPHILPLFDSGEVDSFLFYVMPYVEGETLRDRIDHEKQLPVDEAVALASKVAGALQHAHEHGVIHRDIKPGNILLQGGEPVVADFGIALAVGAAGSNRLTETGLSLGTPYYMSPEQATGDQAVGASTDTYALGSVLYEMLVGEPPYPGTTAQAVLGKIIAGKPVSATEHRPSVPAHVDGAVRKALEKLPADRFTSAQEFVRALGDKHFRYGEEAAAGAGAAVGPWNRLTITMTTLAVSSTLALIWLVLITDLLGPGGGAQGSGPFAAQLDIVLPPGVSLPLDTDYPVLAVSPDGSRIVFVGEREGRRQLYSKLLAGAEPLPLVGTEGAMAPFFPPDGAWIGFFSGDLLMRVAVADGVPAPMYQVTGEGVHRGATWVSDTTLVYVASANSGLLRGAISEGRVSNFVEWDSLTSPRAPAAWPTLVAGTRDVVFGQSTGGDGEDTEVAVISLESGDVRTLINGATSPRYSNTGHLLFARGGVLYAAQHQL